MIYLLDKETNGFIFKAPSYSETDVHYIMIKSAKNTPAFMKDRTQILELTDNFNAQSTDIWTGTQFVDAEQLALKKSKKIESLKQLDELDKKLTRGAEDLIDLLISKNVIVESELPQYLKNAKDLKKALRLEITAL